MKSTNLRTMTESLVESHIPIADDIDDLRIRDIEKRD